MELRPLVRPRAMPWYGKSADLCKSHFHNRRTPLRFEFLELRRLLSITVDTPVDEADGSILDGDVSLRDALAAATVGETIDFDASLSGGTILLTLGDLSITDALDIDAMALPSGLTIDASGNSGRIFDINDGDSQTDSPVTISGVTLTGGHAREGGAIFTRENLTITNSTISGNSASRGGGGIFARATVTLTGTTVSGNSAKFEGGGIFARRMTLTSSTVSGNYSASMGGGIYAGVVTLTSSTVSGNSSAASGGGIFAGGGTGGGPSPGDVTLTNSTVSGNLAGGAGGGILANNTVMLTSSTVSGNSARYGGGGILAGGVMTLTSSTVSGNSNVDLGAGLLTLQYSLIGNNTGTGLTEAPLGAPDANGNLIGGPIHGELNPLLGPLADNGGPTWTHALLPGSPAIEAGDPAIQHSFIEFDQRGAPYYRVADGDLPDDIIMDIGAYETQRPPSADFDENNVVNGRDALLWQRGYGMTVDATRSDGNSDDDQDVDASDRAAWEVSFGQGFELPQETLGDANLGRRPSRAELIDAALAYVMAEAGVAEDESVLAEERLIEPVLPLGVERIDPARASLVQSFRVARSDLQSIGADDFEIEQQVSVFWERGETL